MGQIKNIKLHIVTDIKEKKSKMAPSKAKAYVRKDGLPSVKTGKRGRPPLPEGHLLKPRTAPLTAQQKELVRQARKKYAEMRAQEIAEGKKSGKGKRGRLSNKELLEFMKKQEK